MIIGTIENMYCNEISKIDESIKVFKDKIDKYYGVIEDIKWLDRELGNIVMPKMGLKYGDKVGYDQFKLFSSFMRTTGKIDGKFQVEYTVNLNDSNTRLMQQNNFITWCSYAFRIKFYMSTQYCRITGADFYCMTNKRMDYLSMHQEEEQLYNTQVADIKQMSIQCTPKSYKSIKELGAFLIHFAELVDDFPRLNMEFKKKKKLMDIKSINKEKLYE